MTAILPHARAILWAQWRSLFNFYSRGRAGSFVFTAVMSALWYGLSAAAGAGAMMLASDPKRIEWLYQHGSSALVFMFLYWQILPIFLASTGAGLDLKRLIVYPVTRAQLFSLEVLLRLSTSIEMLCILTGAAIGLEMNPSVRWWGPLAFLPWILFNLALSAGLRDLFGRLLARRRFRELAMLVFVLLAALPQLLLYTGTPERIRAIAQKLSFDYWPWTVTARLALTNFDVRSLMSLIVWAAFALAFGKWQFERGFRFDPEAARSSAGQPSRADGLLEHFYRLPSILFPDPLGALLEKEIRFLSRAPRFRIVFLMGFSFGLLIWLPIAFGDGGAQPSFFASHYLTFVTVYALMLLGEVSFWNAFGFDRGAVQIYYVMPVKLPVVMLAKNLASLTYVLLEILAVAAVCTVMRMPITPFKMLESLLVTLVLTLFLLAVGNLGSTYWPRPVNPAQSWRSASAGRFQALLMLLYPVVSIPIFLAYMARYAFDSEWAFFGMLAVAAAIGCAFYWVAMDDAARAANLRKEAIVTSLSAGEGPVAM